MINKNELLEKIDLPLDIKIKMALDRIQEWYEHFNGKVYVSFSGGKDSTVLLDLVRKIYPEVVGVFVNTGLEFPEIKTFVKSIDNITILTPKLPFHKVIEKYGYPVVSKENAQKLYELRNTKSEKLRQCRLHGNEKGYGKLPDKWKYLVDAPFKISHYCCDVMKKSPMKKFGKETGLVPFIGTMATESRIREITYLQNGCNAFDKKFPSSTPLSFWTTENIWEYLELTKLEYSSIYDMGYDRTGCMFCMFGIHMEKGKNRFQKMEKTHPKYYNYCIDKLGCGKVMDYMGIQYRPQININDLF